MKYRVGTRGSALAVLQAEIVCKALLRENSDLSLDQFELVKIKTSGDKILHRNLADIGGKNLFVKELHEALFDKVIDFAVHSLKDITARQDPDLMIAACLEREDPRDAFVSYKYKNFQDLPEESLIGTSSIRRKSTSLILRPDLIVTPFRGNVQTRLEKLRNNQVDATFLAMAGLKRLKIDPSIYTPLETDLFLPAISQGVIGVECSADNSEIQKLLSTINHKETSLCNQAERGFLESLDADCNSPVAAFAKKIDNKIYLEALVVGANNQLYRIKDSCEESGGWAMGYKMGLELKEHL